MSIISIINEEIQNLAEELNRISMQTAVDKHMFGPVYHGTTTENRENIEREGFKIFMGSERSENIRNGYITNRDYAQGTPPPIHHLGYGVYFTTVKAIGSRFNQDSTKGLKTYYLDVPRLATINFASPKRMMEWWIQNGYDASLAKQGQQGRIDATKKMTETLMKNYDAVWFKGKTMYRVLDGDQIVVFDTSKIYQIDPALAGELEIGSKVRRTTDKFDYQYSYSTDSGESRTLRTRPTIAKDTIGVILAKKPTEDIIQRFKDPLTGKPLNNSIGWFGDSKYIYKVKWNKGGTEANALDKDLEPLKQNVKQPAEVNEEIRVDNIREEIIEELQNLLWEGVADKYAEKQFNISDPNAEMNAKALSGIKPEDDLSMGELVGKMRNFDYYDDSDKSNKFVNIYMNPKKLDNFDAGVRAVSHNADGNLFVAQNDYSFYHSEMSNVINDGGKYNIGNGYDVNKNITWYRIADTNKFRYSGTFVNQTRNMTPEIIQKALELLRAKNPDLEFIENSNYKRD